MIGKCERPLKIWTQRSEMTASFLLPRYKKKKESPAEAIKVDKVRDNFIM